MYVVNGRLGTKETQYRIWHVSKHGSESGEKID